MASIEATIMVDEEAIQTIMEVLESELRNHGALPYVETLTELRNRIDEMIDDCITIY